MVNRKLPFGYCMKDGEICIVDAEAEIVRMIFNSYAAGNSYEDLVGWLNSGKIPYYTERPWNKNNIARILQDEKYLGDNAYPPIIEREKFKKRQPPISGKLEHPQVKDIRILARCAICGETVRRVRKNQWRCSGCMASAMRSSDQLLMESTDELLRKLCEQPDIIAQPIRPNVEHGSTLAEENDFNHEMENPEFNESGARAKAISLAAARFDALGSEDYETMRIRYIVDKTEQSGSLDTALLRQITSAILIHPNGAVSLKLKNGQIITKE